MGIILGVLLIALAVFGIKAVIKLLAISFGISLIAASLFKRFIKSL